MSILKTMSRRSFLVSSSAFLALPKLEAFAAAEKEVSKKFLCIGVGFGFVHKGFFPEKQGRFLSGKVGSSMQPLRPYLDEITMVDSLINPKYHGAHAGSQEFMKAEGAVSCDVLAGSYLSKKSRYQSIAVNATEFGDGHGKYGLSYNFRGDPIPGYRSNLDLYKALFGAGESRNELIHRIKKKKSVLDALKVEHRSFTRQVTKLDREKLEEYFQAIREIELELQREVEWLDIPKPQAPFSFAETNMGGKGDNAHKKDGIKDVKLSLDMLATAFQSGQTNSATLTIPNWAVLTSLGINEHIHAISHYNSSEAMTQKAMRRDKANMELFAYGIKRLKETKDVTGRSVFDSTTFICGSNIRTGHGLRDMPFLVTGGAIKNLKRGHFVKPEHKKVPLGNALLTILNEMGIPVKNFGNSMARETSFLVKTFTIIKKAGQFLKLPARGAQEGGLPLLWLIEYTFK